MSNDFKIYVTGDHGWIRKTLQEDGFTVIDQETALPGEDLTDCLKAAHLVLLVYTDGPREIEGPDFWELGAYRKVPDLESIPVLVGDIPAQWVTHGSPRKPVRLFARMDYPEQEILNREQLLGAVRRFRKQSIDPSNKPSKRLPAEGSLLKLKQVDLKNIGCFEQLTLSLESGWLTILGDNAAGKSTLLRSLVLGLCSESDAVALLKTLPGPLRRYGATTGEIRIELQDPDSGEVLSIHTKIEEEQSGDERVRKTTTPEDFPWARIFVCGYGTNRAHKATSSFDEFSHLAAVRALFPDPAPLQNPELILLRQENGLRRALENRLLSIMMMDGARFTYTGKGPIIQSDRGDQPIQSLSDGYRSTLQWVVDFCGWAIYANRFGVGGVDGGILLVDEFEQHLHPRWQRHIVSELHRQFPTTQILVTTHTPLLASGTADIESSQLVRLKEDAEGKIYANVIEPASLSGQRADQVLTSDAFDLLTSRNRRGEDDLDRYAELLGKNPRTEEEEARFQALRLQLREALSLGETKTEREAERIVERVLDEMNTDLDKEHLDFESRKMLQELLRPGNET